MIPISSEFLGTYLPYLLRRADQALSAAFYSVLNQHGVARSEWRVMAVLEEEGPLSVLELAEAALSPQPTVSHAIRRLVEGGLVQSAPGVSDRRRRTISMTPAGSALTQRLMAEAVRLESEALAEVDGLDAFAQQLRALTATIEETRRTIVTPTYERTA